MTRQRATRFGISTDDSNKPPVTMVSVSLDTSESVNALRNTPMISNDNSTPIIDPRPPKMLTPPNSTAAITDSSKPSPLSPARAREAQRVDHARERAHRAGQHEELELRARHVDAGKLRGNRIRADRVEAASERRGLQQHRENNGADDHEHERHGQESGDRIHAERCVGRREIGDSLIAEQHVRQAAKQRQGADGDGKRGQD